MKLIDCSYSDHGEAIMAIFNEAIANTTALYEYDPRTPEDIQRWFAEKGNGGFPVIGAIDDQGQLMGFATYGTFRPKPAYRFSAEHSVYVDPQHQGKHLGSQLMSALIQRATENGVHILVAGIDGENLASIRLHEKFDFSYAGTIKEAGFKFERWLNLVFYQKILHHE